MNRSHEVLAFYENRARDRGYTSVAGIDEAGRGPLAGPVVAAACILPENFFLEGIDDSKRLSPERREYFYQKIKEDSRILSGIAVVEASTIDQLNILRATLKAMALAVAQLNPQPDYILVDGTQKPLNHIPCETIIKGDTVSHSIMVAAILAKVTRDGMMLEYDQQWPEYEFSRHKGYPTPKHLHILQQRGPSPIHRRSYAPVRRCTQPNFLSDS